MWVYVDWYRYVSNLYLSQSRLLYDPCNQPMSLNVSNTPNHQQKLTANNLSLTSNNLSLTSNNLSLTPNNLSTQHNC